MNRFLDRKHVFFVRNNFLLLLLLKKNPKKKIFFFSIQKYKIKNNDRLNIQM